MFRIFTPANESHRELLREAACTLGADFEGIERQLARHFVVVPQNDQEFRTMVLDAVEHHRHQQLFAR